MIFTVKKDSCLFVVTGLWLNNRVDPITKLPI